MKTNLKQCAKILMVPLLLACPIQPALAVDSLLSGEHGVTKEINTILAAEQNPYLMRSNFPNRAEEVRALYQQSGNQLIWLSTPFAEKKVNDAINLLANAEQYALNPAHYDAEALKQKLATILNSDSNAYLQQALYDTALSITMLRFMHDLRYGTVDSKTLGVSLKPRQKQPLNLASVLKTNLDNNTIPQLPSQVEPKLQQYDKLKQALAKYLDLAKTVPAVKLQAAKKLRVGGNYLQLTELQNYLQAVGDLTDKPATQEGIPPTLQYDTSTADAVKKFQTRHGIFPSGNLDKETINAINVPLTERARQIKLAIERLRWLPELEPGQAIIVNIPSFELWAFDNITDPQSPIFNTRVVVGKSEKNQTPSLMADMKFINFAPYWNVPPNILKEEILPKLTRGGKFLSSQNMEIVGNSSKPVPFSGAAVAKLRLGTLRVRQRPGTGNALGKVKFLFPNKFDVYLHDTPSKSLFSKNRRDFSHGCVRVENPELLADFVFKNQKGWTPANIRKAMKKPTLQEVTLEKPIPVLLFYSTAFLDEQGNVLFSPDIYNRDPALIAAMDKPNDLQDSVLFAEKKEKIEDKGTKQSTTATPVAADYIDNIPSELMQ